MLAGQSRWQNAFEFQIVLTSHPVSRNELGRRTRRKGRGRDHDVVICYTLAINSPFFSNPGPKTEAWYSRDRRDHLMLLMCMNVAMCAIANIQALSAVSPLWWLLQFLVNIIPLYLVCSHPIGTVWFKKTFPWRHCRNPFQDLKSFHRLRWPLASRINWCWRFALGLLQTNCLPGFWTFKTIDSINRIGENHVLHTFSFWHVLGLRVTHYCIILHLVVNGAPNRLQSYNAACLWILGVVRVWPTAHNKLEVFWRGTVPLRFSVASCVQYFSSPCNIASLEALPLSASIRL